MSCSLNIEICFVILFDVLVILVLVCEIWQVIYLGIIIQEQIDFMFEQCYGYECLYDDLEDVDKWLDQVFQDGCWVGFVFSEIYKGEFKLDKLYIYLDVQCRGVGGELIIYVVVWVKKLGYFCVVLVVNKCNDKVIDLYKKYGFVVCEVIVDDIGYGFVMDDFVMEKKF